MMNIEDEGRTFLRRIRDEREELVRQIARGAYTAKNKAGGYREIVGLIKGLDRAEELILEIFRSSFPELWSTPPSLQKQDE